LVTLLRIQQEIYKKYDNQKIRHCIYVDYQIKCTKLQNGKFILVTNENCTQVRENWVTISSIDTNYWFSSKKVRKSLARVACVALDGNRT